jgi:hypothetical protein
MTWHLVYGDATLLAHKREITAVLMNNFLSEMDVGGLLQGKIL